MDEGEMKRSRLSPFNAEQVSTSGVGNDEEQNNEEEMERAEANKINLFLNDTSGEVGEFSSKGNQMF